MGQSAPVCRHDEDVVVDEDSDDQDNKTNRLKVSKVYFHIVLQVHICFMYFVFVFSNMVLYLYCPTHRHKDKVVALFAEEGAGQGKKQEDNVDEDHL